MFEIIYTVILIFTNGLAFKEVLQPKKVANLFLQLQYFNPDEVSMHGKCDIFHYDRICDVYFVVCITNPESNGHCDIFLGKSETFRDTSNISYIFGEVTPIEIYQHVPKNIKMRFDIYDHDLISTDDIIAIYEVENMSHVNSNKFENINLLHLNRTNFNMKLSFSVKSKIRCAAELYGPTCECKVPNGNFKCLDNGTLTCIPGLRGKNCEKRDYCHSVPCKPEAVCTNNDVDDTYHCICNGSTGPHCHIGLNPCITAPCNNGAECRLSNDNNYGYSCICPPRWEGQNCEKHILPCQVSKRQPEFLNGTEFDDSVNTEIDNISNICQNGAECVDNLLEFTFTCKCKNGWYGRFCELKKSNKWKLYGLLSGSILLILVCIIFGVTLTMVKQRKRKRNRLSRHGLIYFTDRKQKHNGTYMLQLIDKSYMKNQLFHDKIIPPLEDSHEYEYCSSYNVSKEDLNTDCNKNCNSKSEGVPPLPDRPQNYLSV